MLIIINKRNSYLIAEKMGRGTNTAQQAPQAPFRREVTPGVANAAAVGFVDWDQLVKAPPAQQKPRGPLRAIWQRPGAKSNFVQPPVVH